MNQQISQSPYNSISQSQQYNPSTQPTFQPSTTPQIGWDQYNYKPPTIEDRLTNIEKDIKEIKETLEWIKWRI